MNLEKILLRGIKIGVILILFTPLILGPFGLTLSAYPKAVFFRSLVEVISIFYLILVFLNSKYIPKKSPLLIVTSIFIGVLILTSITGINFHRSFFGDAERAIGVILYLHLLVFFVIITGVFKEKKEWFNLFRLTVIISGISSLAAVSQKLGAFSFYGMNLPRVSGTLSNPDFFAPYMVLSIFLVIFLLLIEKAKDLKIVWTVILFLNLFTLLSSGTRGAWVGLLVSFAFLIPIWFFYHSGFSIKKRKIILLGILFISIIFFCAALFPTKSGLKDNYSFNRFISIFEFSLGSRGEVWKIAVEGWKERPILGWGPESFSYVFDKNFESRHLEYMPEYMFFDYPHNKIMNLMSNTGSLGVLSYVAIFFVLFYLLFLFYKKHQDKRIYILVLVCFFISYFIQNLFVFDTICTYLIFFLVLGFLNNILMVDQSKEKKLPVGLKVVLIPFLIIVLLITFYQVNWKPTLAAVNFPESIKYERSDPLRAIIGYKESVNKKTIYNVDFRLIIVERAVLILEKGWAKKDEAEIVMILSELRPFFEEDLKKPNRRRNDSYEYLARIDQRIYLIEKDPAILERMEEVLNDALAFNNQRPEFYRLMGELKILENKYEEGEVFFQEMYELTPQKIEDQVGLYKQLGVAYSKVGDKIKAVENFKKAFDKEYHYKKSTSKSIIENPITLAEGTAKIYCRDLKDFETCSQIYQKAIEIYPEYKKDLQNNFNELMKEKQ